MSNLSNQSIVVAGGAGECGEGIVLTLLQQGASLLVPSRSKEKLAALETAMASAGPGKLKTLHLDIGTPAGRTSLLDAVKNAGPLRSVVASLGGFWQGPPVTNVPQDSYMNALEDRLFSHIHLVQTLLPLLHGSDTSLIQLNGVLAVVSIPGLSALNISAAAQLALTRCLIAEANTESPIITSLVIEQFVRTRSRQDLPPNALSGDEIGNEVVRLIKTGNSHAILRLGKRDGQVFVAPLTEEAAKEAVAAISR